MFHVERLSNYRDLSHKPSQNICVTVAVVIIIEFLAALHPQLN